MLLFAIHRAVVHVSRVYDYHIHRSPIHETLVHPSSYTSKLIFYQSPIHATPLNSCCCLLSTEMLSTYLMSTTIISTDLLPTKLLSIHLHTHRNSSSTSLQSMQLPVTNLSSTKCPSTRPQDVSKYIETHLLPVSYLLRKASRSREGGGLFRSLQNH
ncbi:hypothetical protein F2Q68_00008479 [Brassica cretica]|uniref:Uncharacterized protein n=1 Tax=Brassica cretica TaxID=69181 RepID=A0A8S9KKB1_BRACR|nr:hypothetical protein F2Q68_00008479 [Brassica cretica]